VIGDGSPDERLGAAGPQLERAVELRDAFVEPQRQAARPVRDDEVRVLVEDDPHPVLVEIADERDVVRVRPAHEEAAERDGPSVVARLEGHERAIGGEDQDDRRHRRRRDVTRQHAVERFAESFEPAGDLPQIAGRHITHHHEVRRVEPLPLGRSRRRGDHCQQDEEQRNAPPSRRLQHRVPRASEGRFRGRCRGPAQCRSGSRVCQDPNSCPNSCPCQGSLDMVPPDSAPTRLVLVLAAGHSHRRDDRRLSMPPWLARLAGGCRHPSCGVNSEGFRRT
jgi:hypothetical protein